MADLDPEVAALLPQNQPAPEQSQGAAPAPAAMSAPSGMDPDVARLLPQNGGAPIPGKGSPDPTALAGIAVANQQPTFEQAYKGLGNKFKLGMGGISMSIAGWGLATSDQTFDQAKTGVETDELVRAQTEDAEYSKTHGFQKFSNLAGNPGDLIGGWVAQNLPAAGLATAAGLGTGMVAATVGLPVIGASMVGAGLTMGVMAAGSTVYDLMQRGVSKDQAKAAGVVSGVANTIIGVLGPKIALNTFSGAAETAIASEALKNGMHLAKSMGLQVGLADLQGAVDVSLKYITAQTDKNAQPYSNQQAMDDLTNVAFQSLFTMPELSATMHVGGTAAGAMVRHINGHIAKRTAIFAQEAAERQAKEAQLEEQGNLERSAQTKQNIAVATVKATRNLRGFVEVESSSDIDGAEAELSDAKQRKEEAASKQDKAHAQLDVEYAEAKLQQARHQARVEAVEKVLTSPNLKAEAESKKVALKEEIKATRKLESDANEKADNAASDEDAASHRKEAEHHGKTIRRLQDSLREATAQADLSDVELKAKAEAMKGRIEKKANEIKLEVAKKRIAVTMSWRERRMNKVQAEISEQALDSPEHKALSKKLESYATDQRFDEMVKELYDHDIIAPTDVNLTIGKASLTRLNGLVDVAKRTVDSALKAGASNQKKTMHGITRLLDAVVDSSRLPTEDKNALKSKLKVDDLNALAAELPGLQEQIQSKLAKRRHEAAIKDLENVLDFKSKTGETAKHPGAEEALLALKEFAEDPEAINRFELGLETKESITNVDEQKLELVELFKGDALIDDGREHAGIKRLTTEAMEKIIHTIVELKETGKTEAMRRFNKKFARQERANTALKKAMMTTPKGGRIDPKHVASALQKLKMQSPLKSVFRSWDGLMYVITQLGTLNDMHHVFDLKVQNAKAFAMSEFWRARFKDVVNNHGVTDKQYAKALNKGMQRSIELEYRRPVFSEVDGEPMVKDVRAFIDEPKSGKRYNLFELLQIRNYLKDSNPQAQSRLVLGNEFSYPGAVPEGTSTLEVIEAHLSDVAPDLLKIGDALRDVYQEFGTVVDDTAFRRWGRHIEPNETYGGPLHTGAGMSDIRQEVFSRMTTRPGSLLERQGGSTRVEIRNAIEVFDQHIQAFARENAFLEFEQDANHIFKSDQENRDFISRNFGDTTLKVLDQYLSDIIERPREMENLVSRVVSTIRRSQFAYYLGGRFDQYAKQMTGIVHALQVNTPAEVFEGYAYLLGNPKEAVKMMNQSALLRARRTLMDADIKPQGNVLEKAQSLTMKAVEAGDLVAVYGSSFPALLAELKKTGSMDKALAKFDRAMETTQGSGSIDESAHIFRTGAMMQMLTIFTKQATRQVEMISVDFDKAVQSGNPKDYAKFVNTTAISYLGAALYPLAGWVVNAPFMSSEKSAQKLTEILLAAPLGPYASLAFFGLIISHMWGNFINTTFDAKLKVYAPKSLEGSIMEDLDKFVDTVNKVAVGKEVDTWSLIMEAARVFGRATGLPAPNYLKDIGTPLGLNK